MSGVYDSTEITSFRNDPPFPLEVLMSGFEKMIQQYHFFTNLIDSQFIAKQIGSLEDWILIFCDTVF